jgi:hypothetical protein
LTIKQNDLDMESLGCLLLFFLKVIALAKTGSWGWRGQHYGGDGTKEEY